MTKPLLAILLLLPLSVSAGELDGKAIYCKWLGSDSDAPHHFAPGSEGVGFEFKDGRPATYWIEVEGTKAVLGNNPFLNPSDYNVSPSSVTWRQGGIKEDPLVTMKLNRVTLLLTYTWLVAVGEVSGWECEVYTSHDDFQLLMETQRLQKQAEIDEEMSNNKI